MAAQNMNEYIRAFPGEAGARLRQIRTLIRKTIPEAEEKISYGMPSFSLNGKYLVYFAAHKKHIGLYPLPKASALLEKSFAKYKTSGRGTIQFQMDEPLPLALIAKIVKLRAKENLAKAKKPTARKQKTA
ncbi:MAG: DUF1801 domain-containing protein [Cyclobacteriaceae bacterium]|nr:DUF1801 domain-containing protein [Cyclobacteriaceae bacterium]